MSDELDRSSLSASHWAEHFMKTVKDRGLQIDESLLTGWFANYWAAVNDPLQKQIDELVEEVDRQSAVIRGLNIQVGDLNLKLLQEQSEPKEGSPVTGCVFSEKES